MKPKVSIIIPIYNGEKYLENCINSILNQTFKDFEIIFVNDNSKDNSLNIIEKYASNDNRIRIVHNRKNFGQGKSRNIGIEHVQGKYIMFIDQDDWIEPDTLELCYNQIEKNKNDYVIFDFDINFEEDGRAVTYPKKYLAAYKDEINNPNIKLWELKKPFIVSAYVWTIIYNSEFIRKNNIKFNASLRMGEDAEFYFGAIAASETISVIDKVLYHYRKYNESTSSKKTPHWKGSIVARINSYKLFLKSKHKNEYLRSYIPYYIRCVSFHYKHWTKLDETIKKEHYNLMRKIYINLNKKYDISQYKDEINYKEFTDIINKTYIDKYKHGVYFEINGFIKIYKRKNNRIAVKLF